MEKLKSQRGVFSWILIGLFALLFAYDVWEAVGNFVGIQSQALTLGLGISVFGWIVLLAAMVLPVIIFVLALLWSRKMNMGRMFLVFVIGFAVSSVLSLDIVLGTTAYQIFSVN